MIERLQRIATFLNRIQPLIFILGCSGLVVFLLSIFGAPWPGNDTLMIPGLLGFCWALSLYSLASLFRSVPSPPDRASSFRHRLAVRMRRGLLWLFAVFIMALSLSLLLLTYELLRTWFM